jgi:hypothetical protein
MNIRNIFFAVAFASAAAAQSGQQTVHLRSVFNGITIPATSAPLNNIGQAVHVFTAIFPAASANVTGFVLRVEASFDNVTWFPISEDMTTATYNGSVAYAVSRCNGVYPYVRLRYVTAAALAITVHYTGALQPIGLVRLSGTRYLIDSPMAGTIVQPPGAIIGGIYYVDSSRMTPIVPAEWSSVNFAAGTVRNDDPVSITIQEPFSATLEWRMLCRSLPAAPYNVRIHYRGEAALGEATALNHYGVALRNSGTGAFTFYGFQQNYGMQWTIQKWTNPTLLSSTLVAQAHRVQGYSTIISFQLRDDLTTRSWTFWNGIREVNAYPQLNAFWGTGVPRADFTLPDQICLAIRHDNGNFNNNATLLGYDISPTW